MIVPGKIRKVKPGEIVVFEKKIHFGGGDFNALCQSEDESDESDESLVFFDTAYYETSATPVFYNDCDVETVLGYNKDYLEFAYELNRAGITPHDLKEHLHDFEWVVKKVREDIDRIIQSPIKEVVKSHESWSFFNNNKPGELDCSKMGWAKQEEHGSTD